METKAATRFHRQQVINEISELAVNMPGTDRARESFKAGIRWIIAEMNRKATQGADQ